MDRLQLTTKTNARYPQIIFGFEGKNSPLWPKSLGAMAKKLSTISREVGWSAQKGDLQAVHISGTRVLMVGAGTLNDFSIQTYRELMALSLKKAAQAKWQKVSVLLPQKKNVEEEMRAAIEGLILGEYEYLKHKTQTKPRPRLSSVHLVHPHFSSRHKAVAKKISTMAQSVNYVRDLVNEPPSLKVPETMGKIAEKLKAKNTRVQVLKKAKLVQMKMNALLGVNRGSVHPPVLVHLHYKPSRPQRRIALVGKGVTFDSGGLSLKPAAGMMTMKYDMAGAATVFGVFWALNRLQPPVEVHGIAAFTENMPGNDAYKPGDVVRAMNGKTIEVLNTDAEGRVILADALSYATKLPVDEIIDIATLTGAATVALGREYAAVMSKQDKLIAKLQDAAATAGEKMWPLPLDPAYRQDINSTVADMKNIGNAGQAGTIIGGLFLQEFVSDKSWAHLDIASAGWNATPTPLGPVGANGVMVRTLLNHIIGK